MRLGDRRLRMLAVRIREGGGGMALRFQRSIASSRELLRLEVRFGAADGGLGCIEVGRRRRGSAGRLGSRDGLPGVAHFLHGSAGASEQAGDSDKNSNEAQHRGLGH